MLDCRFEPMAQWPRKPTLSRKSGGKFQATYNQTLDDLEAELTKLRAHDIVIQIGLERQHIRNDGWPRSNAPKPSHPGVIVSFVSAKGNLRFLCDTYTDWKANLRAVAKLLERLRLLDLDGVAQDDEQYRGWQALPPAPKEMVFNDGDAAELLERHSSIAAGDILRSPDQLRYAYRNAAQKSHPDKGGSAEEFQAIQEAYERLKARHSL